MSLALRIVDYLRDKDKREREREAELMRIAAEKEREVARLRALQEKAQDKAAEMDALRAKRCPWPAHTDKCTRPSLVWWVDAM